MLLVVFYFCAILITIHLLLFGKDFYKYISTERGNYMRQEKFKMERQGLIEIGDEIEISEYQSFMNYSYIIEPAVAMSGCYPNAQRIKSRKGLVKNIEHTPRGFIVTAEFDE